VSVCNLRLNFYINSGISYENYDKITTEKRPTILGFALPVSIIGYTYREYEPAPRALGEREAEELLKNSCFNGWKRSPEAPSFLRPALKSGAGTDGYPFQFWLNAMSR
jgi:hypothetical protein